MSNETESAPKSPLRWLPLESNPDVMNSFLSNVGVCQDWAVVDVIGLDDDMLGFVPRPVAALILLFPSDSDDDKQAEDDSGPRLDEKADVFFMRQTIENACGTVALIHAVGNNVDKIDFDAKSTLKSYIDATQSLSPAEKGRLLEENESICAAHETSAQDGQTSTPDLNEDVNYHFIAFVERNERLYELDGRRKAPIDHGPTKPDTFLEDASKICRQFMARDPTNLNYTVVALVKQ